MNKSENIRQKNVVMERIKYYFRNLYFAVLGKNPFREELKLLRKTNEEIVQDMKALKQLYGNCKDSIEMNAKLLKKKDKQISGLQTLVENLRERIRDNEQLLKMVEQEEAP